MSNKKILFPTLHVFLGCLFAGTWAGLYFIVYNYCSLSNYRAAKVVALLGVIYILLEALVIMIPQRYFLLSIVSLIGLLFCTLYVRFIQLDGVDIGGDGFQRPVAWKTAKVVIAIHLITILLGLMVNFGEGVYTYLVSWT